ncbi:cellulose-binding protein [Streptomyces sp. NPDC013457]|uniref:cellulose-binding protein n=1 Tax=Streptomyces sp. NPDC013457 TaxID=3364866 RepID=UPI0037006ECD
MSFAVVARGRGYRPRQVDRHLAALSGERDAGWERAARLTVLAREMEEEAVRLRAEVDALAPQRFESLGGRARKILELAEAVDESLVREAEAEAQSLAEEAEEAARTAAESAREYADALLAEAETAAAETLAEAGAEAEALRSVAREEAAARRAAAQVVFDDTVCRTAALLEAQRVEQAGVREGAERTAVSRAAELDARHEELVVEARSRVAEAERELARAQEEARHGQEDAEARAAELLVEAGTRRERVERETERVVREHEEAREEIHAHMEHIRAALASLTGRGAAEDDPEGGDKESDGDGRAGGRDQAD